MKKTIGILLAVALFAAASPAFAQEGELPSAGSTPASPFYFVEQLFEGVGTFLTFGNSAKAERYLSLAAERLAEARVLAEEGDARAEEAVARYEEQYARAMERAEASADLDVETRVTDATTKHLSVLDEVLQRVPEQAKAAIEAAKERSITRQIDALRGIAQRDAEAAVGIFSRAAEGRLAAVQDKAERNGEEMDENVEEAVSEFQRYAEFGKEISALAQGLQTGETTVEELVERATSHHEDVLRDVRSSVPPQARESINRAIETSEEVQQGEQAAPSAPEVPAGDVPAGEVEENEDAAAGGPPEETPAAAGARQ